MRGLRSADKMSYKYDVFLSYNADAGVKEWVKIHLYPCLELCMQKVWPHRVHIFSYTEQQPGVAWPTEVKTALQMSRFMVCVWAPPYFRSPWCMAEWKSMCARAQALNVGYNSSLVPNHVR